MGISAGLRSHANELLALAKSTVDPGLAEVHRRRAISAAYYALFHLLVEESTYVVASTWSSVLRDGLHRTYDHTDMKNVCERFKKRNLEQKYVGLFDKASTALSRGTSGGSIVKIGNDFRIVVTAFVDLQEARHIADYQANCTHEQLEAENNVAKMNEAFDGWAIVKGSDLANLLLFMFHMKDKVETVVKHLNATSVTKDGDET